MLQYDLKNENKQLLAEKELLMSKFWQAENMSSQLHDINKQLFTEIDNMQISLLKMSHN